MFDRRKKPGIFTRLRGFVWPHAGWNRSTKYVFHRLARLPGTAYSIAAGFACGAAISFTPFVGLHFVISAIFAWIIRANILSSAVGTVVGNPWTFPFIWLWIYKAGTWMDPAPDGMAAPDFPSLFGEMMNAALNLDMIYLVETAWPVWWPMLLGSLPTAVVVWFLFYWPLKPLIAAYQNRRIKRRLDRLERQETNR